MGYALAEAAAARGARVILISGPVHLPPPRGVEVVSRPHRGRDAQTGVFEHLPHATIVIKAAAVADFHVAKVPDQKIKKTAARVSLELDPTPDILAELGRKKGDRLLIGFAAETQNLQQKRAASWNRRTATWSSATWSAARTRLRVRPERSDSGAANGESIPLPRASKREMADRIFDEVLNLRLALHSYGR